MTSTTSNFTGFIGNAASTTPTARPGWLSRIIERVEARRRRRQGEAIARFIAANGGVLTDDIERQLSRRFGSMAGER